MDNVLRNICYIKAKTSEVWNAFFDKTLTAVFWEHETHFNMEPGAYWSIISEIDPNEVSWAGYVLSSTPGKAIKLSWFAPADHNDPTKHSKVSINIEQVQEVTHLEILHKNLKVDSNQWNYFIDYWPIVTSSLKTLLETKQALPISLHFAVTYEP